MQGGRESLRPLINDDAGIGALTFMDVPRMATGHAPYQISVERILRP